MKLYWVEDMFQKGHFRVFCKPDTTNISNYFTKNHLPSHHHKI